MSSRKSEPLPCPAPDLAGRTCVVTGATSGIGLELARMLAARGARLMIIGRNPERTQFVADELSATGREPACAVIADLANLGAVRTAAREIAARSPQIDILVNNAGIWITRPSLSIDGFELTWATNMLGHHVLTCSLMDRLRAATNARIVNVASTYAGDLDLDDVEFKRRRWTGVAAYRQSKLALRIWTWALAARLEGSGVTANAVHPGGVYTSIYRSPRGLVGAMIRIHARLTKASPKDGANTLLWAASARVLEGMTARFLVDRRELPCPYRDSTTLNRLWTLLQSQAALRPRFGIRPRLLARITHESVLHE